MMSLEGDSAPLQPWFKKRASARTISARSILLQLSFILVGVALALLIVVDTTVPATGHRSLLNIKARWVSYHGDTPILKLGTLGFCINWAPDDPDTAISSTSPICFHGNGFNSTVIVGKFFNSPEVPIGHIARFTAVVTALHPLTTALVSLVLVTAALPCFIPPIFTVALAWLATASSIAAVGCVFFLATVIRSRVAAGGDSFFFEYGTGIWELLVGAISIWVFTALLTTAWWLRRRSDRMNSGETAGNPGSAHHLPDVGASLEDQLGEFSGEAALRELPGGANSHRHELLNTDMRERERFELGTPEGLMLHAYNTVYL